MPTEGATTATQPGAGASAPAPAPVTVAPAADAGLTPATAAIVLDGVGYAPPKHPPILSGIHWTVPTGRFHVLLGRSGCGKTTLLKLAAGLLVPSQGRVRVEGRALQGPAEGLGFVFQAPTLLDWLTALDNVLLPLSLRGDRDRGRDRALQLLDALGLGGLAGRYPRQLSGGQQARVAVARALVAAPRVLLLDEPFAALDALTREALQEDLAALCARDGISALLVTHDIAESVFLADRVALMSAGCIVEQVAVELPRPRPPGIRYDAAFNEHCRVLRAALDRTGSAR
ncbi:ABC transporter ATP-binding protein [Roseomonas elaeocarpi]|uniref:ABC transporter ATP-binding protein n=1 Tax=Roseomonas elaeocarpi TaxID=907779 RepID=A0ABV6JYZ1_9PROT